MVPRVTYLALAILVLALTFVGVHAFSSYQTRLHFAQLNVPAVEGKFPLEVEVVVNYGPFGGKSPLGDAEVWVYKGDTFYTQNYTGSNGLVTFYLPPGNYSIFITTLHYKFQVQLNGGLEVTVDYAYLRSA
jgi:hypothetical protein